MSPHPGKYQSRAWLVMALLLCLPSAMTWGQNPSDGASTTGEAVPPPVPVRPTETGEAGSEDNLQRFLPFQDLIFLLYKDLDKFQGPDWIIIPNDLWEQHLRDEVAKRTRMKDGWTITDFKLRGTLDQPYAHLTATVTVRAGDASTDMKNFVPVEVNLQLAEAQCTEAKGANGEVPTLRKEKNGPYYLLIDKPGVHTFELSLFVEIDRAPSEEHLVLALPSSGVKSVELTCAEEVLVARDAKSGRELTVGTDRKTIRPDLRMEDSLDIAWKRDGGEEIGSNAIHSVTGTLTYRIDEAQIETTAVLAVEAHADLREWTFLIPPREEIRSVTVENPNVAINPSFELLSGDDHSTLRVRFAESVLETMNLRFVSTRPRPPEGTPVEVGRWEMSQAEVQSGKIEVFTKAALWIRAIPRTGLQRIVAPQGSQGAQPLRAFRYTSQPAILELEVERARPILTASTTTEINVGTDIAEVRSNFRFSVRQAHTDQLALLVPREMKDVQVSPRELVTVKAIRPNAQTGVTELSLSLEEPAIGDVNISLKGSMSVNSQEPQQLRIPVPTDEIEYSGTVAVRSAPNVRLHLLSDQTTNLRREPVPRSDDPQAEPLWFFRQMRGAANLAFSQEMLPRQIDATVESKFMRNESAVTVASTLRFRSKFEPMEEITIRVPEGLGEVLVTGEKIAAPGVAQAGEIRYALTNPVDRCDVVVEYSFPVPAAETSEVTIPLVLPSGIEVTSYRGEVRCAPSLHAVAQPPWESGQPAANDAMGSGPPNLVVGSRNPPDHLTLSFEKTGSLAALVVPRMLIEEKPTSDWRRYGRVRMLISNYRNRAPRLRLPADCRLAEVRVNGQQSVYQPDGEGQWRIFLPEGDHACSLEIGYETLTGREPGPWESMSVEVPRLEPDVAIGEVRWLLQASTDRLLMPVEANQYTNLDWRFRGYVPTPTSRATPSSGIAWLVAGDPSLVWSGTILAEEGPAADYLASWSFESPGRGGSLRVLSVHKPFWILICSGSVLVIGLSVSRSSGRLQVRLLLVFFVVVFAIWAVSPDWVQWFWYGAQWGLYLAVAAIVARALAVRYRRRRYSIPVMTRGKEAGVSSSLIRRLQSQPAEAMGQYGSTMDVN